MIIYIGVMVGKSWIKFQCMDQVNTEIWTINVITRKTLTRISKYKKGNYLQYMQDRFILLGCVYSFGIGKDCIKFQ